MTALGSADDLLHDLALALPLAGSITLQSPISLLAPDKLGRLALQATLRTWLAGAPADLLASIETVGDAYEWHRTRSAHLDGDQMNARPLPRIRLRPLRDDDLGALFLASSAPDRGYAWRYRGATPSPQEFTSQLHAGVLAQFVVEGRSDGIAHGLVCAYDHRMEQRCASIGLVRTSTTPGRGEVLEGLICFIDFLFDTWDFRKLYAEVPGFNAEGLIDPSDPVVRVEGRLVDHCFARGRWWDQLILAIWRDRWEDQRHRWAFLEPASSRADLAGAGVVEPR